MTTYNKNININENGPKITSNGNLVFSDVSLSLKDFTQSVDNWSSSTYLLDKNEEIVIDGKWKFLFVRLRWLDKPKTSDDGSLTIYDACSSISSVGSKCGCSSGATASSGKTAPIPSLATFQTTQYTEYMLSNEFSYLDTTVTLGPTGASAPKVKDLYDHQFSAVLSSNFLYFAGVTGATGATANPYPANKEYYSYVNQALNVIFVYNLDTSKWVLVSTDTALSGVDGTSNVAINTLDTADWSAISSEIGNSSKFIPELTNGNGTLKVDKSIDLEDANMPVSFKFSEVLLLPAYKFTGKIVSDLNNQEINIMLGK